MKKKKLRLAFAMGGGVSLGTFSGAALTECIKHFLVNPRFEEVEIDVFSGASAGALSLAVMLRIMAGYEDKLPLLQQMEEFRDTPDIEQAIVRKLNRQFSASRINRLSKKQRAQLIAAQIAQEFQKLLWCYKVDIWSLVGMDEEPPRPLLNKGSLLDRSHLIKVAKEAIIPNEGDFRLSDYSPLANRVLFANTLTRIDPIEFGSSDIFSKFSADPAVNMAYKKLFKKIAKDGTSSNTHRDVRVFDIHFGDLEKASVEQNKDKFPLRWLRAHQGPEDQPIFDLKKGNFWSAVTATTLAASAFPFAFEQVLLTRYDYEYGTQGIEVNGQSFKQYPHSYIDGGTFNNEPISEAFRLAAFMDSLYYDPAVQRYVVFVDPFISQKSSSKVKDYYRQHYLSEETKNVLEVTGLQKMAAFLGPMISMMRSEASISELDKSVAIFDKFEKRKQLRHFFNKSIDFGFIPHLGNITSEQLQNINREIVAIRKLISEEMETLQSRITIPKMVNFHTEVRKMLSKPENKVFFNDALIEKALQGKLQEAEGYQAFFDLDDLSPLKRENALYIKDWVKSLYFILLDMTLDLIGKDEDTKLIPIGPVVFSGNEVDILPLQGKRLEAFIGFFDLQYRLHDFYIGQTATFNILSHLDLGVDNSRFDPFDNSQIAPNEVELEERLKKVLQKRVGKEIINNVKKMFDSTGKSGIDIQDAFFKTLGTLASFNVDKMASMILHEKKGIPIELRILVDDDRYQIDNQAQNTLKEWLFDRDISITKNKDGSSYLLSAFPYYEKDGNWQDHSFIENGHIKIVIDRKFTDKVLTTLPLPTKQQMEKALAMPYPILSIRLKDWLEEKKADWVPIPGMLPLEEELLKEE